jgi:hypothetical protein
MQPCYYPLIARFHLFRSYDMNYKVLFFFSFLSSQFTFGQITPSGLCNDSLIVASLHSNNGNLEGIYQTLSNDGGIFLGGIHKSSAISSEKAFIVKISQANIPVWNTILELGSKNLRISKTSSLEMTSCSSITDNIVSPFLYPGSLLVTLCLCFP